VGSIIALVLNIHISYDMNRLLTILLTWAMAYFLTLINFQKTLRSTKLTVSALNKTILMRGTFDCPKFQS
jgi:hypothetical protein